MFYVVTVHHVNTLSNPDDMCGRKTKESKM